MATRIDLVEDVLPISELRLRAAQQISKIQETQRPLVITQYGKAVAVLMEVGQFQSWQDRLTMLEEKLNRVERERAERRATEAEARYAAQNDRRAGGESDGGTADSK